MFLCSFKTRKMDKNQNKTCEWRLCSLCLLQILVFDHLSGWCWNLHVKSSFFKSKDKVKCWVWGKLRTTTTNPPGSRHHPIQRKICTQISKFIPSRLREMTSVKAPHIYKWVVPSPFSFNSICMHAPASQGRSDRLPHV